ncbi:MAG: insulinase family protein [Ardenticatenales bacterium]|nr:insulinase family protein [Ardenticatenales bacterium]
MEANGASRSDIQRTTLDNGLTVLTREMHHAPVTTFWLWYRVGSRNEIPGVTGISHWVEHMMFKGTERFPKGTIDRALSRLGGSFNAMTSLDFTAYYATLPADKIDLALEIEADRMSHAAFDPSETEAERTVILSELHMYENSPGFRLAQEVTAAAFQLHPYHHETIGWESDLLAMTRDDLYRHYRTYYTPNNAIAVAVGDFRTEEMVERLATLYGGIPMGPPVPAVRFTEPRQRGERRVTAHGTEPTPLLTYAYKAPAATDPDFWALTVLDTILGGPKSGSFGGSGSSRTCRLYRRLVDGALAVGVGSSLLATIDPYLYSISVTALPTSTREEIERVLEEEIVRLQQEPLSEEELRRARKQTRARFAMGMESMSSQGRWLGFSTIVATINWFDGYLDSIDAVTAEQVQAVAQRYLLPTRRTVGWYIPT